MILLNIFEFLIVENKTVKLCEKNETLFSLSTDILQPQQ